MQILIRRRASVGLLACALLLSATAPRAQTDTPASFEVASIKANKSGDNRVMMGIQPGGRMTMTNVPLRLMIRQAYRVQDFQIVDAPGWVGSEHFDILAKAEGNPTQEQMQQMLRALLAERFKLAVHTESREMPVYALVVARQDKLGPKLTKSESNCAALRSGPPPSGPPPAGAPRCGMRIGPGTMTANGMTFRDLVQSLSTMVGRVVQDKTGLEGEWDFTMEFAPESRAAGPDGSPASAPDRPASDLPSIFTAVQEQLGLKLDSQRAPVDVLVIDKVEQPTLD
jgi:uncharacterized protein (TIGR03435 family)